MFDIDWAKLIRRDVPFAVRKPKMLAYLLALISPVITLYNRFLGFRSSTDLDLLVTGQVRILRYHINQRFDLGFERIEILDGDDNNILYIFLESENQPVFLPQFISGNTVDFIVRVPQDLAGLENQIKDFLNRFKLASKRYEIIYF